MRFCKALFIVLSLSLLLLNCGGTNETNQSDEMTDTLKNDSVSETSNNQKTILFFGNSLTAGYGINPDSAFPKQIELKLDSIGLDFQVINAGLSGETTSSGLNRLDWVLEQPVDILVIELGANDGLRGIDPKETRKNLQGMIDLAKEKFPEIQIVLAGMEVPPNMGAEYTDEFRKIYPELSEENEVALIPFLLDKVAGNPDLNLPDGIHPTAEGHQIVTETVWNTLKEVVGV